MSRFTDWTDQAIAADEVRSPGKVVLDWRHRLLGPDGAIVASTDPDDGGINWGAELRPLVFDRKGASTRLAQLSVPATDLDLVPDQGGPLHPDSGYRVSIEAGLVIDGVTTWQQQAMMLAQDVNATDTGLVTMDVRLVDTSRPIRSNMTAALQFSQGDLVSSVVERLLGQVLPDAAYSVAPTSFTMPRGSVGAGEPRDRYVFEMLASIGHELTTTPEGRVITRPILSSADDPGAEVWRYGQDDGIPIDKAVRSWTVRTPQGWRIEGGSFQDSNPPITLTVWDTDPASAGFYSGQADVQLPTMRANWITSMPQAAEAGYGQLRKFGVGPMQVTIWSVPNPGIREGDIVELERPNLKASGRFRVVDYELPLQVDGQMRLVLRKVYDPAANFIPPNPTPDGCLVSKTSDFSDPNEFPGSNLEAVPPAEGSPAWEEIGISWGIHGGLAVQRHTGTWCLAQVTRPICSSNQYATIDVVEVPSGRAVGPWVRGSGRMDGYAFLFREGSQRLSLERWLNGHNVETLAATSYPSGVDGASMTISAVGTTITASIGAAQILSVTDDAATGNYVGMLGYGGSSSSGPKVSDFDAGLDT